MNTREQLNQYLRGLEARLRWMTVSKGAAVAAGVALGATIALVLITNALAFSSASLAVARVVLFLALAVSLGFALVIPLMRLNVRRTARRAESTFPEFQERLLTLVERADTHDPMLELLADETASVAAQTEPERVAPRRSVFAFATSAGAACAALLWLILAGPGFLGYGASLLWAGLPKGTAAAFYDIQVQPGNKLVRRKADQVVTAQLVGFQAPQVKLLARYKSASKWEEAPMVPRTNATAYEFLFASLPEPVEYYVEASGVRSKTYRIDVVDLPSIKKVKVTYHFPSWLGLKDAVEDPGGDLRAVAGTVAELTVETDRPLKSGRLDMDDGSHISLDTVSGNTLTAKVPIQKDGVYHFAATEQGDSVRLSEDYFIEARVDNAPTVRITRPGADAKVSPIEEVIIAVEAEDDYALDGLDLHYSVNGSPEKTVSLLANKGVKTGSGKTMLSLEDYKMQPGDVVSVYATAKDARNTSQTDMLFVETQPYERNYTQSQQMGGGGGGGGGMGDQTEISQRQKEIIAATWNEIRGGVKNKAKAGDNATFLSEVQDKLKEQAQTLAQRSKSRQLAGANQEFSSFTKDLEEAAKEMGPAAEKLKAQKWREALEPEERALQHLLRAEATFRDIQVAFGNRGGGGGGGGGAGRDLANMFDLELDTEKNQYETGQQAGGSSSEQRQKEIDEALQKLEELARRQQALAQQQRNSKQQSFDQRWQQEMLRRDVEELKRQMEQLSRNGQQQQQGQQQSGQQSGQQQGSQSGQQSGQSQPGQSGQGGQPGSQQQQQQRQMSRLQGANEQRLQQSLERLRQAADDMRAAQQAAQREGQQGGQQAEADARRAAERLQEARDMLNGMRQQEAAAQLNDLQDKADRLAAQQHDFQNRLRQAFGDQPPQDPRQRNPLNGAGNRQQSEQLANEKDKMAADLDRLEQDMQKAAHDMNGTQPGASSRLREGLSEIQQTEAKLRMKFSANYIRQGQGGYMVPREQPLTETLDKVSQDIRRAQEALNNGGKQQAGNGNGDVERSLAQVERLRSQMERMAGRGQQQGGQQQGDQQGQGQQGQGQQGQGQQGQGQQGGNSPQGGGGQRGGGYTGGSAGGRYAPGPRYGGGRYFQEGLYDLPDVQPLDPQRMARDATRELNELRQMFKDNPEVSREIVDLENEIQKLSFGATAGPELQNRINREVLPNLEALEVQLRRQLEEQNGGQVRSGASDKVPSGYVDAVAEYFRKLSKGK